MRPLTALVIGNCSIDQYMRIGEPHLIGEKICFIHGTKIPVQAFKTNLAGNACHVAMGLQNLDIQTTVYTELGNDENGRKFVAAFKERGINTAFCHLRDGKETNVHTVIAYGADRTIFSYHSPIEYALDFEALQKPDVIYYTSLGKGFEDLQKNLINYLDSNPDIIVAFNPGTYQLQNGLQAVKQMLKHTQILLVNKEEAQAIVGKKFESDALHAELRALGVTLSLITDGGRGASVFDGEKVILQPAAEIKSHDFVDKTGAGDAFSAAFVAAIALKKPLEVALTWGQKNALSTIKHIGGTTGLLTLEKVDTPPI